MTSRGAAEGFGRHVQINLSTRDLAMPEEVLNGDETDASAHEMRGKSMAHPMRTKRHTDVAALAPGADALVDRTATERSAQSRSKERRGGERGAARVGIELEDLGELRVE